MALKDLSSLFDLVGGNQPVGDMENQQGAQSFDLGPNSQLQQNSLPEIPVNSPYQDLNGQPGPQFDLGEDSMLQENSLPNIPTNSPFQDLDGEPGPQFDLGTDSTLQTDNLVNLSSQLDYPDLNGIEGGNGFFHGINNPGTGQGLQLDGMSLHERLLTNNYSYQHGNSQANIQPGTFDLDGTTPSQYINNMPD